MSGRRMLIESDPHQTGIAVVEDDRLTEIFLERHRRRSIVGNLYKGRVTRVLPGMQAAFVDIGLERDAFLYVSDVAGAGGEEEDEEADDGPNVEGEFEETRGEGFRAEPSITDLLVKDQELVVQVVKAPLPNKGARITTQVTLPGRYLVLLPTVRHFAVSRRIEDDDERQRLLDLLAELELPDGGLIVRTVGAGKGRDEFRADLDYLLAGWQKIGERAAVARPRELIHQELGLTLRVIRDLFSSEFDALLVDGAETHGEIVEFLSQVQPALLDRVELYQPAGELFDRHRIPAQIAAALKSKVWLKSGGHIVINQTEALVAIDVNTGRYTGKSNLEQTVLKINLEAVEEIVRQIRLRNLGGIIVVDLIDMVEPENRAEVFAALERELARDRAKHKVLQISEFGLVEITRKRSRASLERLLTRPCPYCSGSGRIRAASTVCLELRREALRRQKHAGSGDGHLRVRVHPEVAQALQDSDREILTEIERELGMVVLLEGDPSLHREQYDLEEI